MGTASNLKGRQQQHQHDPTNTTYPRWRRRFNGDGVRLDHDNGGMKTTRPVATNNSDGKATSRPQAANAERQRQRRLDMPNDNDNNSMTTQMTDATDNNSDATNNTTRDNGGEQ
ncbi:hypothetical protein EDB89DRAFT_1912641 [Lactarius sanguifluus]|nr:hypothetical protein EDB89DRAFT_1912641 [Lactarius sanguifluus]